MGHTVFINCWHPGKLDYYGSYCIHQCNGCQSGKLEYYGSYCMYLGWASRLIKICNWSYCMYLGWASRLIKACISMHTNLQMYTSAVCSIILSKGVNEHKNTFNILLLESKAVLHMLYMIDLLICKQNFY